MLPGRFSICLNIFKGCWAADVSKSHQGLKACISHDQFTDKDMLVPYGYLHHVNFFLFILYGFC